MLELRNVGTAQCWNCGMLSPWPTKCDHIHRGMRLSQGGRNVENAKAIERL